MKASSLAYLLGAVLLAGSPLWAQDRHGTKIDWHDSVEKAQRQARDEKKLLLILHISGVWSDPERT